jgi:hypothetical protein
MDDLPSAQADAHMRDTLKVPLVAKEYQVTRFKRRFHLAAGVFLHIRVT